VSRQRAAFGGVLRGSRSPSRFEFYSKYLESAPRRPAHGRDRYPGRESGAMLGSSRNFASSCGGRCAGNAHAQPSIARFERMSSRMTLDRLGVLGSPTRQIGHLWRVSRRALVIAGIRKGITSIVGSGKGTLRIGIWFHFRSESTLSRPARCFHSSLRRRDGEFTAIEPRFLPEP
jgi:hypothetical protein